MDIKFVRFKATDNVELQGWFSDADGDMAVVHIHGMSGNGYENYFLDDLRTMYNSKGIAFFSIDTRGRGIISDFRQGDDWKHGGSCFELFDESIADIDGAIQYVQSLAVGKKRVILEGHSLGCTKVVNYYLAKAAHGVEGIVLLAPTDMAGWAKTDPNHDTYLSKAKEMIVAGNGEELVSAQCWIDKTPISAQTYATICEPGSNADIYGDRENRTLLGRVGLPMLIAYGTQDIGITEIDGTIDNWLNRVTPIKNPNTKIEVVEDAAHGFRGYETELSDKVADFTDEILAIFDDKR